MRLRMLGGRALLGGVLFALAATLPSLAPMPAQSAEKVVVFAAASLKNALDDIAAQWERDTGEDVAISFAGSSKLARQIQQGAPADLFLSANVKWMDVLEEGGLIQADTRHDLLRNRLVLIAHGKEAPDVDIEPGFDLAALLTGGRLAMALVDSVPAGIYGKAALSSLGIWEQVSPRVAQSDNVRTALALVARGEAPYGVAYATDAAAEDNVTVVGTFPADSHPPIIYPVALTAGSDIPAARDFLEYLSSGAARLLFERQGFTVIE